MPTYRVLLRRPTTRRWDWVQIVDAANADVAISRAYITWVKAAFNTWVPRLPECQSMVEETDDKAPTDTLPLNIHIGNWESR